MSCKFAIAVCYDLHLKKHKQVYATVEVVLFQSQLGYPKLQDDSFEL